jgi:hypothetical protein
LLKYIFFFVIIVVNSYGDDYLETALSKKIYEEHAWKALLHMPDKKSEIMDDTFFLSSQRTAKSELISALEQINKEYIVCQYPARYNWLKNRLNITDDVLDIKKCKKVHKFVSNLEASSVYLVYTSAYFGTPVAMFGHDFLYIKRKNKSKMLGKSVNFYAYIPESTDVLEYVFKGLFGGFEAKYSLQDYYLLIKEYSDLSQRDIWEYELDFSKDELEQFLYHLYEVKNKNKNYTFTTLNCSYNIYWLIEVAKSKSIDKSGYIFLPAETVGTVKDNGWIKKTSVVPSLFNKIKANIRQLENDDAVYYIRDISNSKIEIKEFINKDIKLLDKQIILTTSALYLQYLNTKEKIDKKYYKKKSYEILKYRSKLGINSMINDYSFIENPENIHQIQKVSFKFGEKDGESLSVFNYRLGYHSLDDLTDGFLKGSELVYLDISAEVDEEIKLDKLTFLKLSSFVPRDVLFKPISWQLGFNLDRKYMDDDLQGHIYGGVGPSYNIPYGYTYLLVNSNLFYKTQTDLSISGKYGLVLEGYKNILTFNIEKLFYTSGEDQLVFRVHDYYSLDKDFGINIEIKSIEKYDYTEDRFLLGVSYYF